MMPLRLPLSPRPTLHHHFPRLYHHNFLLLPLQPHIQIRHATPARTLRIRASDEGESYLGMWKNAVERQRKAVEFQKVVENTEGNDDRNAGDPSSDQLEKKSEEFSKILQVPPEERDRIQRMQVIHRAAAAIAAARALVGETGTLAVGDSDTCVNLNSTNDEGLLDREEALSEFQSENALLPEFETSQSWTPGPDFWSWTPPPDDDGNDNAFGELQPLGKSQAYPKLSNFVEEKERPIDFLSIPFQSEISESVNPLLPPFQSLVGMEKLESSETSTETHSLEEDENVGIEFSVHAAEASQALSSVDKESTKGIDPDGSRWWKETGIEQRPDGVICKWTLTRGVSADLATEWQNKYWEAADEFGYKELGSEKSGRDAYGNVWREYWRESMRQEQGLVHLEKTADKWGINGSGTEWQEKWWEYYNTSGQAEKNAHKWCKIDPNTYVDPGHAHIWNERWGEKYDGQGGSIKYTDKWAERCEGDGWTKWGDKWDENFDPNGHGIKQGETWWEGRHGERWNRTWGEGHNGSGWVHKYGKSSSGEHWDTHAQQETWYERFPHFGFYHCFNNSVQLREVQKPSERAS
ncbi:uncharacterized protein LOC101218256 [Cucumis sativus]|uniref:Uncharacterized protein n=1 Tax=Cucumis sativus TaxID=3659 RepID=A0A0A0LNS6_CUCSA|nr:uncharacterized protein LOC101218256 [Cucumis sativus]KGN61656.1 hypothetical protein Csa_006718 [Cucumis sativus]